jgi:hypothetical protein
MCTHEKSRFKIVEEKQAEQLKTGIRKDTIFMGFKFGMTEKQTFERFRKLADENVFTINKRSVFEYQMNLDTVKTRTAFHTSFYHDSLYSFSLILKGKKPSEAELIQLKMVSSLMKEYGDPIQVPSLSDETKVDYYFIRGNQQVKIEYPDLSNKTIVTFSDYSFEKRKNSEEQQMKKDKEKSSLKET